MSLFWYVLLACFVGIILGVCLSYIFLWIYYKVHARILKNKIPDDDGVKGLANPGKEKIDIKEVDEYERARNIATNREFEKLRRIADDRGRSGDRAISPKRIPEIPKPRGFQDRHDSFIETVKSELERDERSNVTEPKIDDRRIEWR